MKSIHFEVAEAVKRERDYQDAKWGTPDEHPHTVGEWLLVVEAELQEAKQAWCKGGGDYGALEELLQVAAVAFACLEQHGIVERPSRLLAMQMTHETPDVYIGHRPGCPMRQGGDECLCSEIMSPRV